MQPFRRMCQQVPVLVNSAALYRHAIPDGSDRNIEPRCAIDNEEFGPPQPTPDKIVERGTPSLGHNVAQAMKEITANLPVGIEPTLIANQPVTVDHAVDDFMEALWEAIAIVLAVSLIALGLRAGAVVALAVPLVLAAVFVVMIVPPIILFIGLQRWFMKGLMEGALRQ